jgi:predicted acylesterase/phospholipase RssA
MARTALCISGGGLDGFCLGVGVLKGLEEIGALVGDLDCWGTSAGSALACWVAAGRPIAGPNGLESIFRTLADSDIRDPRPMWRARLAWIDNIWEGRKLRAQLDRLMPRSADLRHPWHPIAVPIHSARPTDLADYGNTPADACAASMAIPCVFPPVLLADGIAYQDGGLAMNLPLPGGPSSYDTVIAVILSGRRRTYTAPRSVLSGALAQFGRILAGQTEAAELRVRAWPNSWVIRPEFDGARGMLHLDHSLIDSGYRWVKSQHPRFK